MPLYLKDKLVSGSGAPGKSAYETAKEGGYTGTEEEFAQILTNASQITNIIIPLGRMIGDVNNDGFITLTDSDLVNSHFMEFITLTGEDFTAADTNKDSIININDVTNISTAVNNKRTIGSWSGDIKGNWSINPNYASEDAQFYIDIAIEGFKTTSNAIICILDNKNDGRICRAESLDGALRIYATLCPIEDYETIVIWEVDGQGNSGIIGYKKDNDVLVAEWEVTTFNEIEDAVRANKIVILNDDDALYTLEYLDARNNRAYFKTEYFISGQIVPALVVCYREDDGSTTWVTGEYPTVTRESLGAAPMYTYGTEDIEAGSASTAATGTLHFVYE